ncbi:MAG: hypothetical protein KDA95_07680 [Acidimicrobiales bacterium]|nr:hypothetical protein [Acidimicrobiales bacterium]
MVQVSKRKFTAAALGAAMAISLGLGACGGSSDEPSDTKIDDNAASIDATETTTTEVAPEQTTTTVAAAPTGLPDQQDVVLKFYDAWFADDRVTAATVADQMAIDNMWKTPRGDYHAYNKCSTGEFDTSGCLYRGNLGTIQFDLEKRGDNWVVAGAMFSDPSSGG